MKTYPVSRRVVVVAIVLCGCDAPLAGQEALTLAERFEPGHLSRVEVVVRVSGRLSLPDAKKAATPKLIALSGESRLTYDERLLPPDEPGTLKAIRAYREVEFVRTLGDIRQDAGIRPSVRRMVVIQSGGRRAPFSPDGPLTWGEIDVVRTDVFNPSMVPGLLPGGAVGPGQGWKATSAAVAELTDLEKVEAGEVVLELVGVTEVRQRRVARLRLSGDVRGVNQDGPTRHRLDGTAYFDLAGNFLSYLSLKGTRELLDGSGQTVGRVEGLFTMTRSRLESPPADLSDASLRGLDLKPGPENTLLLYDDPRLGIRLLYPRGWRVGAVQGKQVTLDHARGAGLLITVEPAARVPSVDEYAREIGEFLHKEKVRLTGLGKAERVRADPNRLERFGLEASFGTERVRLEYAVLKQPDGGATVAARIPLEEVAVLKPEVERIIRSLAVTKKIE
jgi:hypothetical protein